MDDSLTAWRGKRAILCLLVLMGLAGVSRRAEAADHFLTIGGGYAPSGNQVSLEKNVLFFRQVLADLYPQNVLAGLRHDVYFSDGDSPGRDLQYEEVNNVPEVNRLIARLSDEEDDLGYRYRTHAIKKIRGPATKKEVEKWFAEVGVTIPAGDRLFVYMTGHGGKDESRANKYLNLLNSGNYANNHFYLWNGDKLSVREFSALLDTLPAGVNVVAVMVQCYSGGFADLMFQGGLPQNGPGKSVRCGFLATMPDRVAAGCTPDVNEAGYEDYSSSFWAALRGKTRGGVAVERSSCDYDGNGVVTFAEAHAHVLLTDDSIDIPMTTSDRFLRLHSDPGASRGRLVSAEEMYARLNAVASPVDRAVIDGLTKQLGLDAGNQYRYAAAKKLADSLHARHRAGEQEEKDLRKKLEDAGDAILDALEFSWPELKNRWDPAVDRIFREESQAVVRAIKSDGRYADFAKLYDKINDLSSRDDALEEKWAKSQRLMRAMERVALAHNIEQVADGPTLAQYKALVAAESGTLGPPEPGR